MRKTMVDFTYDDRYFIPKVQSLSLSLSQLSFLRTVTRCPGRRAVRVAGAERAHGALQEPAHVRPGALP
jgi:hypothetical protein